jgi:hypothetical protein
LNGNYPRRLSKGWLRGGRQKQSYPSKPAVFQIRKFLYYFVWIRFKILPSTSKKLEKTRNSAFCDFLMTCYFLKNDVNVPTVLSKKLFSVGILKGTEAKIAGSGS